MRPPGWFRLVRAGVFAAACVELSRFGHDLMAVRPVPQWAAWTALLGLGAVGYQLADRRRSVWWILLAVEVVQGCLHVWFSACTPAGATSAVHMEMRAGGMHAVTPMSHGAGISVGMFGAHVMAGALVALWLCVGERALWRALGRLFAPALRVFALLIRVNAPVGPHPLAIGAGRDEDEVAPETAALRHVLVRRGPPQAGVSRVSPA